MEHPSVLESAVPAVADPVRGQVVKATMNGSKLEVKQEGRDRAISTLTAGVRVKLTDSLTGRILFEDTVRKAGIEYDSITLLESPFSP